MFEAIQLMFLDYTVRTVTLGALVLGVTAGCLGTFAILRQQSLLGDAISHATLPGVGIAFLLTQEKNPLVLLIGAAVAGWLGTVLVMMITRTTRIKRDTALGMILSVFFGLGLVILTIVQKMPMATKSGLNKFLFGNAATLLNEDIITVSVLGVTGLLMVSLFWKEFKILVFDYEYAKSIGLPVKRIDLILTSLIVLAIVIGLQMVGVVLMSAMLVAPAAAARQWTDRLGIMVLLSAFFGAAAGIAGSLTSSTIPNLPTGPTIVIYVSIFVLISVLFAPNRGLLWDWLRTQRQRNEIQTTTILKNLLFIAENHADPFHPHDIAALQAVGQGGAQKTMMELLRKGWVKSFPGNRWALTQNGLSEAKRLMKEYEEKLNVHSSN